MILKVISETTSTQTEQIGFNYYCIYCGKQALVHIEWDEYNRDDSYYCDCELAKLEQEVTKQIQKIQFEQYPKLKSNEEILNKLKYNHAVENLKLKYKQK